MTSVLTFLVDDWASDGVDDNGCEWTLDHSKLSGWYESPPVQGDQYDQRSNAAGSFDRQVYDGNRVVTFGGRCWAPSVEAAEEARRRLYGHVAQVLLAGTELTGRQPDGDFGLKVKRSAQPQHAFVNACVFLWQVTVTAVDPYKYGPATSVVTAAPSAGTGGLGFPLFAPQPPGVLSWGTPGVSGRVTLDNPGTADAWPVFQAVGPWPGGISFTDRATGRMITYPSDIPDGATLLVVDSADGSAKLNGADRTGLLVRSEWFSVPRESSAEVQVSALGVGATGSCTVTIRPAYS